MKTIKAERAGEVRGVSGRFFPVVAEDDGRIRNQRFGASRVRGDSSIRVSLRFDDECNNGHETFAMTGEVYERGRWDSGGCIHETLAEVFPELAPLIKWHVVSTDGPMHYPDNALFLAGERDCWGRRAGEPSSFNEVVRFGTNPIRHRLRASFAAFLRLAGPAFDFEVVRYDHGGRTASGYKFAPKYTLGGYGSKWHECPFDTESEALDFLAALQTCGPVFERVPVAWSDGKPRELDKARSVAVWPEATDEELSQEPEALRAALLARLPGLLESFKADMLGAGFIWPEPR